MSPTAATVWTHRCLDRRASTALYSSPGRVDPAAPNIPAILANEAITHTDPPQVDSIELYNPTGSPVNSGGWFLTDDRSEPMKYAILTNTIVPWEPASKIILS